MMKKEVYLLVFLLFLIQASGQHYIYGRVYDSYDSIKAHGREIMIYYIGDETNNATCIVGGFGKVWPNDYGCDAEAIPNHNFIEGDVIYARVLEDNSSYAAGTIKVTTQLGQGWSEMPDMILTDTTKSAILYKGWNLIGYSKEPLYWLDITVYDGKQSKKILEAADWIQTTAFFFDASVQSYRTLPIEDQYLKAWNGYWVYSMKDRLILVME